MARTIVGRQNIVSPVAYDSNGDEIPGTSGIPISLNTLIAGEDQDNDVMVTEQGQFGYETVAVSQTDQVLGATGAAGDFLHKVICVVATAATSAVSISPDGGTTDISILPANVGGGVGTYPIEVNAVAETGGWAVTTGAGVTVMAVGRFT